jgi:signal transduction histidine kinase
MIKSRIRPILYCDDTEEQRYAMRRILEKDGYTVIEAATGGEALEKIHAGVLAVVLDVKLPDMSGYEVCRRIKADPATAAIPVLQVSASFADPALRARGLEGGADAYVAQPVHAAELVALVGALIRSYNSDRMLRFQAEVSRQLALTLDYNEILATIERVFVPRFADECLVLLRPQGQLANYPDSPQPPQASPVSFVAASASAPVPTALLDAAMEVSRSGHATLIRAGSLIPLSGALSVQSAGLQSAPTDVILAPLAVGRKLIGTLLFSVDGIERSYQLSDLALAQDLADRAALALQNANLYTAQRAAQAALIQSEKLAAAGRLSAAIAHEINNPLEAITNLIYLIDTSEDATPAIKSYSQEALSELSRLTHIARQSLGFYRELTGAKTFDLNQSIEDTVNIYLKRFEAKHIRVERHYAPGPLELRAVTGEVRQVISNLLVNAYDALPEGGTLRIETALLSSGSNDLIPFRKVVFRVIDDGPGIPPETQRRIFEPFFTTKQDIGTGLGLWVSDTIVAKHGGTIEVTTRMDGPNRGTMFEVTLPQVGGSE